jgi:hypothetical protein
MWKVPTVLSDDFDVPFVLDDLFPNFESVPIASSLQNGGFWSNTVVSSIEISFQKRSGVASSLLEWRIFKRYNR